MTIYSLDVLLPQIGTPVHCSMSSSNCCFLTCIQISQDAAQVVWYSHPFQNFPQVVVIHTVKGFGNLISDSSAFSESSLNIWKFTVHILLKPRLENFEYYFAIMWNECSCAVFWTVFGTALLWDWNENWLFPVLWPLLSFPNWLAYWVQHFNSIMEDVSILHFREGDSLITCSSRDHLRPD